MSSVEKELRDRGIPVFGFENVGDAVEGLVEILGEMDRQNALHALEAAKEAKVILAVMKPDWVAPYRDMGNYTGAIIFSTHPRFKAGWRLDKGFAHVARDEGYTVILLQGDGSLLPVEAYIVHEEE